MIELKYFKSYEFTACTPSCSVFQMDEEFLRRLEHARCVAGVPFVLTSAYRSPGYDRSKGRSGNGYHTLGRAVDIKCTDSRKRFMIVFACLECGLSCGIADTFIHIDDRPDPIVFLY